MCAMLWLSRLASLTALSERGRRLCLLCEAGPARFAIPATSVLEVANPDPGGATLRGHHPLVDLCQLLGGPAETRPGTAVLLDTSPTLALRVKKVYGARDVAECPWLHVPRRLIPTLEPAVRGLVNVDDQLFLELDVEALAAGVKPPPQVSVVEPFGAPLSQGLVFETGGRLLALPLASVAQIVALSSRFCALVAPTAATGVILHQQQAWPVFSLAGLLGEPIPNESLVVLTEVGGDGIGFTASRALGVLEGTKMEAIPSLELKRMFS
jgi:chemotaxis signal transduction protein